MEVLTSASTEVIRSAPECTWSNNSAGVTTTSNQIAALFAAKRLAATDRERVAWMLRVKCDGAFLVLGTIRGQAYFQIAAAFIGADHGSVPGDNAVVQMFDFGGV
jgi:hypothetical protein